MRLISLRFSIAYCSSAVLVGLCLLGGAVNADAVTQTVIYSFQGIPDGMYPVGGVVFDKAGNLYGVTTNGGNGGSDCFLGSCGTVYQLTPSGTGGGPWTETVIYNFKGKSQNDGEDPYSGLLIDGAGNLYGATGYGGTGNCTLVGTSVGCGTVFKLSPPPQPGAQWTETILYNLQGGSDGYLPYGDLTVDKAGNIYGSTLYGGGYGICDENIYPNCGTVFRLSPSQNPGGPWLETVLYRFKGGVPYGSMTDGANPNGGLTLDGVGALYGSTQYGGNGGCDASAGTGCGTVFKLVPPAAQHGSWIEQVLYRFHMPPDGSYPFAGVILDEQDNVYGTNTVGGANTGGTLFKLSPPSEPTGLWIETILHNFGSIPYDGVIPEAKPTLEQSGNLYGTTIGGGPRSRGTVFHLDLRNNNYNIVTHFKGGPTGGNPNNSLKLGAYGNVYMTTADGGIANLDCDNGCGTVIQLGP
jgi:uncharacterized repeat protein (TIGR03803 family)